MTEDIWFEQLAEMTRTSLEERAPASLTSKVYSSVVMKMAQSGSLLDLKDIKDAGGHLCVFEHAIARLPIGGGARSMNPCRVCHARVLGERMENAPIFWPGCPYSDFHKG
jgi:hypothetical protein